MTTNHSSAVPSHLPASRFMTLFEIRELSRLGEAMDEKVTPFERFDARGVHFRNMEFTNFHRACMYIKHCWTVESVDTYAQLVG
jgi:hypothetical protein